MHIIYVYIYNTYAYDICAYIHTYAYHICIYTYMCLQYMYISYDICISIDTMPEGAQLSTRLSRNKLLPLWTFITRHLEQGCAS